MRKYAARSASVFAGYGLERIECPAEDVEGKVSLRRYWAEGWVFLATGALCGVTLAVPVLKELLLVYIVTAFFLSIVVLLVRLLRSQEFHHFFLMEHFAWLCIFLILGTVF